LLPFGQPVSHCEPRASPHLGSAAASKEKPQTAEAAIGATLGSSHLGPPTMAFYLCHWAKFCSHFSLDKDNDRMYTSGRGWRLVAGAKSCGPQGRSALCSLLLPDSPGRPVHGANKARFPWPW
jgi:hypothetical protein